MPSSVISRMEYNATSSVLRIVFVSGMIYDYKNVPEAVYIAMQGSTSKGTYLNQHIKGTYKFKKIQ